MRGQGRVSPFYSGYSEPRQQHCTSFLVSWVLLAGGMRVLALQKLGRNDSQFVNPMTCERIYIFPIMMKRGYGRMQSPSDWHYQVHWFSPFSSN
ncbi:hypothetical protein K503DRAFT_565137 [Rhizopogon vinicolor AM-OR11-026]|uniref:Uncharacterized protein n=1 Tax=Rhizopogon vinicolor AM-OR11-026 TaxID=1314800 RepID=A0A1B7N7U6_9AGAM|nr:hypothetical protein K503DRAFT_565137 [Rhizopogon vinicolor AM-OR11-026]